MNSDPFGIRVTLNHEIADWFTGIWLDEKIITSKKKIEKEKEVKGNSNGMAMGCPKCSI